jgi:excisionase family DNA binding protein
MKLSDEKLKELIDIWVFLMTPAQTSKALAISPRKLWGMTASGEIPHVRIGKCVRYRVDSLQQWLADQEQGAKS